NWKDPRDSASTSSARDAGKRRFMGDLVSIKHPRPGAAAGEMTRPLPYSGRGRVGRGWTRLPDVAALQALLFPGPFFDDALQFLAHGHPGSIAHLQIIHQLIGVHVLQEARQVEVDRI